MTARFPALARRSAGALAALAAVLLAILPDWPGSAPTIVLCALAAAGAGFEISRLASPSAGAAVRIAQAVSTAAAVVCFSILPRFGAFALPLPGLILAIPMMRSGSPGGSIPGVAGAGWMSMLWALGLGSIARLRAGSEGPWLALLPLVSCWAGDTAAYFAGCAFGRHRLAPGISPGKTVEGLAAGLAGSTAAAVSLGLAGGMPLGTATLAAAGLSCGLAGAFGDLLESAFKRDAGVKDSGAFLPGHGGILDRTDSIATAAPVALLFAMAAGAVS